MRTNEITAPLLQGLSRRSRSLLLLLDSEYRIVLGENEAIQLLHPDVRFDTDGRAQLTAGLRALIQERLVALSDESDTVTIGLGHLILRVVPLKGILGRFTAVTVETLQRREDLVSQRQRYHLTPREVDVLRLILRGLAAHEVAEALNITKNTVNDYFKSLLHKTNARNRSDMIAKILGWEQKITPIPWERNTSA